ncbi:MAG: hypothetical protein AWM53_00280 [Candidatus Dichloromethanomonas elyunquensis]|nr:MAG: hypothetical protein AWM53_00280 [Candidatus Dichloromethanomonas elyunquensis]
MEAIDCATPLTLQNCQDLKNMEITAVGRYLGYKNMNWWKSLSPNEVMNIHTAGLSLFLIWESSPTHAGYFSYIKGISDANFAADEAGYLGAPGSAAIYFTVDYDAQTADMAGILEYFRGVKDGLGRKYLIGAYGSFKVMTALKNSANPPDKYFQTYVWSQRQIFSPYNIYQYRNNVSIQGIAIDRDSISQSAGTWPEIGGKIMDHAVVYFTDRDFSSARIVSDLLGGCAMFCQNGQSAIHPDAFSAKHLVVIGGKPVTNHSNVTNCCGLRGPETAILAAQYAQSLYAKN